MLLRSRLRRSLSSSRGRPMFSSRTVCHSGPHPDRRLFHLARVDFLVAVERGLAGGPFLLAGLLATGFLAAGFLAAGFLVAAAARLGVAFSTTSVSACGATVAGSVSGVVATPIVLDSVR